MFSFLINFFQRRLPLLSVTEKVAIDSGDVWWEAELLSGAPKWHLLESFQSSELSLEEKIFIQEKVAPLCEIIKDFEIYESKKIPKEIWSYLKKEKFLGLVIPKTYGGLGFSAVAHSTIVSLIASRSLSVAICMMVPNSLGTGEFLLHYGTEAQRKKYLPRLALGKEISCFALTSKEAGSDASSMTDKGIVCIREYEGEKTLGIKLTFHKRYITLAPIATLLGLAFKCYDPDHLLGNKEDVGITFCLVKLPKENITIKKHHPLGLPFPNGVLEGQDVFVPIDNIIGGIKMAGKGWKMLVECLSIGRSISLPALCTAMSQVCFRSSGAYAAIREQFKQPLGSFGGIQHKLAMIGGFTYLINAARTFTTIPLNNHLRPAIASAIIKYHLTEFARIVVNHAMDIQGGYGIQMGPRNILALLHIASPIGITVEGANVLTRNLIIFGQGLLRTHPFLRKEIDAIASSDSTLFKSLLWAHIKYTMKNLLRLLYTSRLNRMSAALAICTDVSVLCLGGELKRKENLSARLGDVLSMLYLASSVIKHDKDHNQYEEAKIYREWSMKFLLNRMQKSLDEFCDNFPKRWIGRCLKFFIFPLGKHYSWPSDKENQAIAQTLLSPGQFRTQLLQSSFVSQDNQDTLAKLEKALILKSENSKEYADLQKEILEVDAF